MVKTLKQLKDEAKKAIQEHAATRPWFGITEVHNSNKGFKHAKKPAKWKPLKKS